MTYRPLAVAAALAAIAAGALAQQPKPTVRASVAPADATMSVSLTVKGANAEPFLTVTSTNADVRDLFREMARKSGEDILLSPSVTGRVNADITSSPVEKAVATVAGLAGLSVRRIVVPDGAPAVTVDTAGMLTEALAALPDKACVVDPTTGKALVVSASAAAPASGSKVVFYVQGKLTPEQERAARDKKAAAKDATAAQGNDLISSTVNGLKQMPIQQRLQAMNDLRRQMFDSMSPDERQQMFDAMRQQRQQGGQQGGRGGWGGPRGGGGGNGN
ncbi:MAG TPA: hypothetical protein VGM37_07615 [Armatimonadota bacterium]|jgi:hypothetical protein